MTGASAPLATRPKRTALSAGGALIALGVVSGDIGTSPMYVLKAVIAQNGGMAAVSDELILGALSLVIWTLTLLTTVKYVLIAMRADNRGEGGIFALYSLVRRYGGYLVIPAMVGGAALLADGMLTPAVTVTTAIEGLRTVGSARRFLDGEHAILLIVLAVITLLFLVQRAGTSRIGKAFGPVMGVWFLFLAAVGVYCIGGDWSVLRAFNPLRGLGLLFSPHNRAGLLILGSVFLATTGAEALGLAAVILWVMAVWYKGTQIERSQAVQYPLTDYLETLRDLRGDTSLPLFCDNLVYITRSRPGDGVDRDILYSIFDRRPKRAAAYWLVSIAVTDEPYTRQYTVQSLGTDYLFRVQLQLGFKVHQQVNTYLRQIVTDLIESGELPPQGHRYSVYGRRQVGDFRFCILRKQLPAGCALPAVSQAVMACKYAIRRAAGTPIRWYGLENAATFIEYLPLFVSRRDQTRLARARPGAAKQDTGTPASMRA
ncbi:KUP/HAK/KT family potassium transporter [Neobittarella massiliensis]|uniref:KUP/HAK/KT family potassium transporter n=2 Tax=Neobittarella massiliensis (ex Bilen et al. 2018) TaxID=2041842 RepID=A0A8J6IM00_9FIRM|nr:KUP/HAK/KT family potassium transporter [Neobittarella massiliensis]